MKVWIYYLSLPDDLSEFNQNDIDRFQYIAHHFNRDMTHDDTTGTNRMLYAFTTSKKIAREFQETRDMSLFTKVKRTLSNEEYKVFIDEVGDDYELIMKSIDSRMRQPSSGNEGIDHIIRTGKEENSLYDDMYNDVEDSIVNSVSVNYEAFKDQYIRALDYIMYCTYNKMVYDDPDSYSYNLSYGCTAEGYPPRPVGIEMRIARLYFMSFGLLLRKEDKE